ncbi:MAG: Lrp/AsnC ligand binding domain-containing protein [Methanomassiliicoccales archaeon]|nr:MAG: Lrp/AsnC ligand binding domain-containing protein [Methanomassiliicoccales archaeon]
MLVSLVLIKTAIGKERGVEQEVRKIQGVREAHLLFGVYDISVKVECDNIEELTHIVIDQIRQIDGVRETKTLPGIRYGSI